jgi:hypothetical protein
VSDGLRSYVLYAVWHAAYACQGCGLEL